MPFQRVRSTAPPPRRKPAPSVDEAPVHAPLRLTVSRGTLGMELYEPIAVGIFEVTSFALTLPGLRFPVDLSGGVARFRHRRGELQQLRLRVAPERIAKAFEVAAGEALGGLLRPVAAWPRPSGLSLGFVGAEGALAFDLLWAPQRGSARGVVANVRGAGLRAPALGFALRLLDSAWSGIAQRRGRTVTVEGAARRLVTALAPALGARAPGCDTITLGDLATGDGELEVEFEAGGEGQALPVETVRALEIANLSAPGDEALLAGELDQARSLYLDALERAPRHPDLTCAVAEIDLCSGGRSEAALGLLVDSMAATQAGLIGAELLAQVGDLVGAREAVAAATVNESYAPIAALGWARLAGHEPAPLDRLNALDRACARAPALTEVRWNRLEARLERRDAEGALADAQHLEAATQGAAHRHLVCCRAARLFLDAGQKAGAGKLFERALRYLPDDPIATAGLARSFMESNQPLRAVTLLERAVSLSEKNGLADAAALIDLAKVLARQMKDLPAAVSRLRQVPAASPRIVEARALEGRFRASLGDLAGATLAYARMRDAIEFALESEPRAKRWLEEAARFEEEYQRDVLAAERHLAVALRLAPHEVGLKRRYRRVAGLAARHVKSHPESD